MHTYSIAWIRSDYWQKNEYKNTTQSDLMNHCVAYLQRNTASKILILKAGGLSPLLLKNLYYLRIKWEILSLNPVLKKGGLPWDYHYFDCFPNTSFYQFKISFICGILLYIKRIFLHSWYHIIALLRCNKNG